MRDAPPALVACSHGTRDPAGRRAIDQLRAAVASARPGLRVVEAYVDVQAPALPDVLAGLRSAVVVPLLLSSGYHVHVDIADAVDTAGQQIRRAVALGPHPALVEVLAQRLAAAGVSTEHAVVLAAAGSSDRRALTDVEQMASDLSERIRGSIMPAYASAAEPRIGDAIARLRSQGRPVAVSSYLLAPGVFYDQLREAHADLLAEPLLPHPVIAGLVLRRYDEAVLGGPVRPSGCSSIYPRL